METTEVEATKSDNADDDMRNYFDQTVDLTAWPCPKGTTEAYS